MRRRHHPLVIVVAVILALEALAAAGVTIYLVIETFIAPSSSIASALALAVVCAIAAVWIAVIVVNVLRGNAWTRSASIVIQVLIIAIAIGSFSGIGSSPLLGVILLVPALVVIVALFSKPVMAATTNRNRGPAED